MNKLLNGFLQNPPTSGHDKATNPACASKKNQSGNDIYVDSLQMLNPGWFRIAIIKRSTCGECTVTPAVGSSR